ncbi:MAG: ABC transporter ATP-binding protein [Ancalomicrobiaceae bacterium]|nr:ABC transporter ATP-binding protein [Ancalomicrobiaceae bacterium]
MAPILSLQKVSKSYGAIVIANNLDLDVGEGEALGMLGPNGAGKTTLFGLITGTVPVNSGRIEFLGEDISRLPPEQRCHRGLARSFQVPQPFGGMTVFENLTVSAAFSKNRSERDVYPDCARILDQCGLTDKANARAGGLTLLDRKRLEFARALATKPKLLLLDEVAGGLSEVECEVLVGLIKRIRETGIAIVWIEHVIHALVATVDRVVVLAGGMFVADDTPENVVRHPKVAEIYMGLPGD